MIMATVAEKEKKKKIKKEKVNKIKSYNIQDSCVGAPQRWSPYKDVTKAN